MYVPSNAVWANRLAADGWTPEQISLHLRQPLHRVLDALANPPASHTPRPRHKGLRPKTVRRRHGGFVGMEDTSPYDISDWPSRVVNGVRIWDPRPEDIE